MGLGNISLRYDKWLDEGRLYELLPCVHIEDIVLRILDVYQDGHCHFERLVPQIPLDIKSLINTTLVPNDMEVEVIVVWAGELSGLYSTKVDYH